MKTDIKKAAWNYWNLEYKEGVTPSDPYTRSGIKTFTDGAKWGIEYESAKHNSKSENLWQTLNAFRIAVLSIIPDNKDLAPFLSLVDQCLIENRPTPLTL